jgi:cobalt-precorrin 5A hydrolase
VKRAIIAVTLGGKVTALKIQRSIGGELFTLDKYCTEDFFQPIQGSLKKFMKHIFQGYREIVMVMSCGIAVRSIAPYVESKVTDPAVVVVDEQGHFAISLLSGHLGGANELAQTIAPITGGQSVITTASDNLGLVAVDMIAQKHHLKMDNMEQVKKVTAALVNSKKVVMVNESPHEIEAPRIEQMGISQLGKTKPEAMIYVGYKKKLDFLPEDIPVAKLVPQRLVLGIGCRKNIGETKLREAIENFLEQENLTMEGLKAVATVDVKKDEPAICAWTADNALPLIIVDRSDIAPIQEQFSCSDFVKKTIGVGCVCEPAAYLVSHRGRVVAPKTSFDGITLCVFEDIRSN